MAQGLAQKTVLRQLHIALTVYKVCRQRRRFFLV